MMCDAWDRCFDIILVKSVSRFSRNSIKAIEKVKELRWLGIELRAEDENISTLENEQHFELEVRMAIAQAESESLSNAIKLGHNKRFSVGTSELYRRRCFGYCKD